MDNDIKIIRKRFIERDFKFAQIKTNSKLLQDEDINKLLDDHEWDDYTFTFVYKNNTLLKTIITNNHTGCDSLPEDLCYNAKNFYSTELRKANGSYYIQRIWNILHKNNKDGVTA